MESLPIASPDYTALTEDLRTWLKSRPELTDYDFDGSVLSTLVGMLGYNTTMNAFYLNQVANEAYLETSSKRQSAVMNAQDLGYEVTSKKSAVATVRLTLTETTPTSATFITLPADSAVFTTNVNNKSFTFRALSDVYMAKNAAGKYVADIKIYEGKQFVNNVTVTSDVRNNGFLIENKDVDTSTIQMKVDGLTYTKANNIVDGLDGSSKVFFLADKFGSTKVYFGDGIVGFVPAISTTMVLKYLKSSGDLANGIGAFSFVGSYAGTTAAVETVSAASGGANEETIDSIKFNAPKWFASQGRCVTEDDYKVILTKLFPAISDITVWGGEKNDPPIYGKVFLAIKPYDGYYLTNADKTNIVTALQKYNVVTILPEVVDPDYVFVDVVGSVEYQQSLTDNTSAGIADVVKSAVQTYAQTELGKFSAAIRYSRFANVMLDADPSIQSVKATMMLSKHISPTVGSYSDIAVDFKNVIKPSTLVSSEFTFNSFVGCRFVDDGLGNVQVAEYSSGTKNVINQFAGTIDYVTGKVNITRTYLVAVDQSLKESTGVVYMNFESMSEDLDINTTQKNILVIDKVTITTNKV
jgi:hypothetical protein